MIDWYRELDTAERRTFWACFGGWALDALDVQIYSFVVPALIALWHITNAQAGLLATSALVISAFGGWLAGMLADRVGRARLVSGGIAAGFEPASGLAPAGVRRRQATRRHERQSQRRTDLHRRR